MDKIGAFVQENTDAAWAWVSRARPRVVKWLNWDNNRLAAVHGWGGKNIGRIIGLTSFDVPSTVSAIGQADLQTNGLMDYWELVNEPSDPNPDLVTYSMSVIGALKRPILVGNFSEGNPAIPNWPIYFPMMRLAQQYGGGLALHEYGYPSLQASAPWHTLRYRLARQTFPPDLQSIPVFITELGIDGGLVGKNDQGWQTTTDEAGYLSQLQWYAGMLQQDQSVAGATIFLAGHDDPWATFEIQSAFGIADAIRSAHPMSNPFIFGIDVSNNNGDIVPWSVIAKTFDFVSCKATEGLGFIDPDFADNWQAAADYGIPRIAYHFARPSQGSGHDEANFFLATAAKNLQSGDIYALDSEDTLVAPAAGLAAHHLDFYSVADPAWGAKGLLYSGLWYMGPHGLEDNATLSTHGLWIAQFGTSKVVALPGGWSFWAIHQYGQGPVPGFTGAVDLDRFAGTVTQLRKYGRT